MPYSIVSDNGTQFQDIFKAFCSQHGIKNFYASVAYPQCNGQAEAVAEISMGPSWMDAIISYLKDNVVSENKKATHKLKLRADRFWLLPEDSTENPSPDHTSGVYTQT